MERMTAKLIRVLVLTLLYSAAAKTATSQEAPPKVDLDALAAKGSILANQDPLAAELRNNRRLSQRGFDIGMAIAEGQTLPGPGKDRICASLQGSTEQRGCSIAVSFSVERNRNAELARKGAAIAKADPAIAATRNASRDVFYKLGFDIGLAAAEGQTLPGPGKDRLRDSLLPALRGGFSDAVSSTLERNRNDAAVGATTGTSAGPAEKAANAKQTPESRTRSSDETTALEDSGGSRPGALERKRDPGRTTAAFQPENTIKVSVRYKKEFGYKGDTNAFGYVGPTSCDAFSVSAAVGDDSARKGILIRVSSDSKMEEAGDYYICSYLVSEVPLNHPMRVSVSVSGLDQSGAWKGGSHAEPARGQQRTIIIVSGREGGAVTLTADQPRARQLFEMVYTSQPR